MDKKEQPILNLIKQIQSGDLNPKDIDIELRRQIVEVLTLEGTNISQIAKILNVSDKTIRRDISAIKENNSLSPSLDLAKKLVGDLKMKAETHISYLMRLARLKSGTTSEKSLAEYYSWKITKEFIEKLQSLGYLPLAPHKISAEIFQHTESPKSLEEMEKEVGQLQEAAKTEGIMDEEIKSQIKLLTLEIEKEKLSRRLNNSKDEKEKKEDRDVNK